MLGEFGHIALISALCLALWQGILPVWSKLIKRPYWLELSPHLSALQLIFLVLAFGCLSIGFLQDDFSLAIVVANSNTQLSPFYKFCALWGNHEGSLLLWTLVLCAWSCAFAYGASSYDKKLYLLSLTVLGWLICGFLITLLFSSNPFERLLPFPPAEGRDLNPLLQDFALSVHPPILYCGLTGLAIPYALAVSTLIGGKVGGRTWAYYARPWTLLAWAFLSVGIVLGSWWAYYELGWGGWWFWDPVENISLMPWLATAALIHAFAVLIKRGLLVSWSLLLAIIAFSLSLLGAFLVRSGILVSVHSFATDPTRGVFFLVLFILSVTIPLLLYGLRIRAELPPKTSLNFYSKEFLLSINNTLLLVILFVVLSGTLFPLLSETFGWGSFSVGKPWFESVLLPIAWLLMLAMVLGQNSNWHSRRQKIVWYPILAGLGLSLLGVAVVIAWKPPLTGQWVIPGLIISSLVVTALALSLPQQIKSRNKVESHSSSSATSYLAMLCGHLGVAVLAIGVTIGAGYTREDHLAMALGDSTTLGEYRFVFNELNYKKNSNYDSTIAEFEVWHKNRIVANMHPEKRHYYERDMVLTEAAIDAGFWRDLHIALGEPMTEQLWSLRISINPMVRWIWGGGLLIALAALYGSVSQWRQREAT